MQVGTSVASGVRFQWRHSSHVPELGQDVSNGGEAAGADYIAGWREDLSQLSGGQRSLVALALLLSARASSLALCQI